MNHSLPTSIRHYPLQLSVSGEVPSGAAGRKSDLERQGARCDSKDQA